EDGASHPAGRSASGAAASARTATSAIPSAARANVADASSAAPHAGRPVLSTPSLADVPPLFTPTFRTPEDEVEDQLPAGSCRIAAHGRLGQKPIRAILDAAGVNLTLKLSIVASGETIIYRGELA
ncbi:MAG TPA: hypothetical protein VNN80_34485, partial [Polyangiaceae bacterium]|nr:hypothetical protein [Polyangiaceae bacterium]